MINAINFKSTMRKLIVSEWMTLDGVFDAGTMKDWFIPFDSEARRKYIIKTMDLCQAILFGRTTYEMLAPYWSPLKNNEDGLADKINSVPKYVVSSTLKKADWNNTTIIKENIVEEVAKLKQLPGAEIHIEGSATLVKSLMEAHLIDEYQFLIHPIIIGSGKRFFKDGMTTRGLSFVKTETLDKGVVLQCYQPIKN
jgi:dihydrofolate reductase